MASNRKHPESERQAMAKKMTNMSTKVHTTRLNAKHASTYSLQQKSTSIRCCASQCSKPEGAHVTVANYYSPSLSPVPGIRFP